MKNYAIETDVITTPDPLFYPGDRVEWCRGITGIQLIVESFAWNTLKHSWTYTLIYFIGRGGEYDRKWDGSLAIDEALEKDVKLTFRQPKK